MIPSFTHLRHWRACWHVAAIAIAVLATPACRASAAEPVGVPNGATGFVYFNVEEMRVTKHFSLIQRLITHVDTEASMVSVANAGFDITTVREVVVMAPPLAHLLTADTPPVCAVVQFSKSFRARNVARRLGEDWKTATTNGNTYFVSDWGCMHVASNNTLVVGSPNAVQWYVEQGPGDNDLTDFLETARENVHISVSVDLRNIPAEAFAELPEPAQVLAGAQFIQFESFLGEVVGVTSYLFCQNEQDATARLEKVKSYFDAGIDQLVAQDDELSKAIDESTSLDSSVESLALLAVIRESVEVLEDTEFDRDGGLAWVSMDVDPGWLAGITMVAAIGGAANSAEATFQDISQQLDEAAAAPAAEKTGTLGSKLRAGSLGISGRR